MELSNKYISNKAWKRYQKTISDFLDIDAGRQKITWARNVDGMLPYSEDLKKKYIFTELEVLVYYNSFRNWPINKSTVSGELDDENLLIYISKQYVKDNGFLTEDGYFNFNWVEDRFVINGLTYRPTGDTEVAQAKDQALIFQLILKRDRDTILTQYIPNYYSSLVKLGPLIHEAYYPNLDYSYAREYFKKEAPEIPITGCSAIKYGNFFCRHLDWYKPHDLITGSPDVVIHTPRTYNRAKVSGVCNVSKLTESIIDNQESSEAFRILPFYLQDGINEYGVYVSINVVPRDKGFNTYTVPTISKEDEICSIMVPRYVLDKFTNSTQAVKALQEHVSIFMPNNLSNLGYEVHYMIGDDYHCYVVEIINNQVVYKEHNKITNFFIDGVTFLPDGKVYTNADADQGNNPSLLGITPYGSGLERYNILVENSIINTKEEARSIMNQLLYSKAYDLDNHPFWYSEFTSPDNNITVDTHTDDPNLQYIIEETQKIKRGEREGRLWITTHSCVYDLTTKSINIVSQEDTSKEIIINF